MLLLSMLVRKLSAPEVYIDMLVTGEPITAEPITKQAIFHAGSLADLAHKKHNLTHCSSCKLPTQ